VFQVICADGRSRHADPFPTRNDAARWADQGHCCLARHHIGPAPTYSYPTTDGPHVQPFSDLVVGLGSRALATAYVEVGSPVCSYLDMNRRFRP
jgi:hypothetical protein